MQKRVLILSNHFITFSNINGSKDVVEGGVNGYLFEAGNSKGLIDKVEKFLKLDYETKKQMGLAGRKKVEKEFDRKIVVDAYIEELVKLEKLIN